MGEQARGRGHYKKAGQEEEETIQREETVWGVNQLLMQCSHTFILLKHYTLVTNINLYTKQRKDRLEYPYISLSYWCGKKLSHESATHNLLRGENQFQWEQAGLNGA